MNTHDFSLISAIKRIAVLAMVSDDELMELLVFKGGSAIDMIYNLSTRASLDLDFSMENGLTEEEQGKVAYKIQKALTETFLKHDLFAYDIKFKERPKTVDPEVGSWWGGYEVKFKVIENEKAIKLENDIDRMRKLSIPLGKKGSTVFKIDISPYEYCEQSGFAEIEDYTVRVYTPEMLVFEKLRAICQQMPEYKDIVKRFSPKARARDFYDASILIAQFEIEPSTDDNRLLIKHIFEAKKVPLDYIKRIKEFREFHREDFDASVKTTVGGDEEIENYDYYFDNILRYFDGLSF